ncbi:MAG: CHASE2 domain-containing protein [Marinoscillum sp.]
MKKVLVVIGIAIVLSLAVFYLITSREYQRLDSRYVKLQPGKEELIVLVNVGNGDRKYIAEKINKVFQCNPKLIGIDLYFKEFSPEIEQDSLLLNSIQNSKPILATRHMGIGTQGVNKVFLNAALDHGYAELNAENGYVSNFDVFREMKSKKDFHFAYTMANKIDSIAASRFVNNLDGNNSDVVIRKLSDQFKIFDFNENINCEQITNKVVLFGYLGPTDEDKLTTYARFHDDSDASGPDMYGPIVVANQILMILKDEI